MCSIGKVNEKQIFTVTAPDFEAELSSSSGEDQRVVSREGS